MHSRSFWNDRRGVSPLIATILLIAITVAIAAIVLTISENLAEETIQDPPPSTSFIIKDHNDSLVGGAECGDTLFTITVDEEIRLRDFTLKIGMDDAFFDVWGENETMIGNINRTFEMWRDGFQDDDYELTLEDDKDIIEPGDAFVLKAVGRERADNGEEWWTYLDTDDESTEDPVCETFGFGDELQIRLIYATGDILKDITLKLQ